MDRGEDMTTDAQRQEVESNYDYFMRSLSGLLPEHLGEFALIRSRHIVKFFATPAQAYADAIERYGPSGFSIQEVTEEPIDLGFFSHVAP